MPFENEFIINNYDNDNDYSKKYNIYDIHKIRKLLKSNKIKINERKYHSHITLDKIREAEKKDELIETWKSEYSVEQGLQMTNCVYLALMIIRHPILNLEQNGMSIEEFVLCIKIGSVIGENRNVYKRLSEEFDKYNAVYIVPLIVMYSDDSCIQKIEKKLHDELHGDNMNIKIGCLDRSNNITVPKEFYVVGDNVLDKMINHCIANKMEQVYTGGRPTDTYFDYFDHIPIEEHYSLDNESILIIEENDNDNLTKDHIKTLLQRRCYENIKDIKNIKNNLRSNL
jgi:hypothetical protein